MELATITMPKVEARKAFIEYRRAVRARHNSEDEAIMRGYKALALGRQIINIRDAFTAAGFDELRRPKLALCRADAKACYVTVFADGDVRFQADADPNRWNSNAYVKDLRWLRNITTWPERFPMFHARSIVPVVPPGLRPAHALAGYDILYEAEWRPMAPKDPALLKKLGGDLYVVVATWDLTPLEQAVIGGTRRA